MFWFMDTLFDVYMYYSNLIQISSTTDPGDPLCFCLYVCVQCF